MKPRSLSATALKTAQLCLARYAAEHIDYARGIANPAALQGTTVHGALELFVKACYIDKTQEPTLQLLLDFYQLSYVQTMGTSDFTGDDYGEGEVMLRDWFKRTSFEGITVISSEVKESFEIKTSSGPIPYNYIWDRCDDMGNGEIKVVDYKTNRWGYTPQDLRKLIQVRCYAVAAQIKFPNATRIWVELDMLRHDGPVGVAFSREDNIATWHWIKREVERILATPRDKTPETLNPECNFCVRKLSCDALKKNVGAGGVFSFTEPGEMADVRAQLEYQGAAIRAALNELDSQILAYSKETDEFQFEGGAHTMEIAVSSQRAIDPERVSHVLGAELMQKYGKFGFNVTTADRLLKGDELTEEQKKGLRSLFYRKQGEPRVKTKAKNPIDDD